MKKKIIIILGLILLIVSIYIGKVFIDMNEMEKQNEEFYSFRELLDEVYIPILHDADDMYQTIVSDIRLDFWYLMDDGQEENDEILNRLMKAKNNIEYYNLTNPDAIELKEIIMNNIEAQTKLHETIKSHGDAGDLKLKYSGQFMSSFNEELDEVASGIGKMNNSLGKYYTH